MEPAVPQRGRLAIHGRHRARRCRGRTATRPARPPRTSTTTGAWISSWRACSATSCSGTPATGGSRTSPPRPASRTTRGRWPPGWFDYDNDGWLDLFVVNYVDWTPETNKYCGDRARNLRVYCHPRQYKGLANALYRNRHDGTFEDVSEKSGIAAQRRQGDERGVRRLRWRRLHRRVRDERRGAGLSLPEPARRHLRGGRRCSRAWPCPRTAGRSRAWAWTSGTSTTTGGRIST